MLPRNREQGFSLTEVVIALGIMAVLGLLVSAVYDRMNRGERSITQRSELANARSAIMIATDCKQTLGIGSSATPACVNGAPPTAPCSAPPVAALGAAAWLPLLDARGNPVPRLNIAGVKTTGNISLRACCPGGALRVEYRALDKSGNDQADALSGAVTAGWKPLFAVAPICSSKSVASPTRIRVRQPLGVTAFGSPMWLSYPGFFPPWSPVWEGTASCPAGKKLRGGGVQCLPWLGTVESHPVRGGTAVPQWAENSTSWFASCGGIGGFAVAVCE